MKRLKTLFGIILSLIVGCVFAFGVGEVFIRMMVPQQEVPRWFAESEEYGYTLKENFSQTFSFVGTDYVMDVQTNEFGHRDGARNPDAEKTILLLGDSFTFGYGVDVSERFDTQLEALLDVPIDVINAGTPGWGTAQEVKYGRAVLERFEPDVVVITFCGNDPQDDRLFLRGEVVFKEGGIVSFPGKALLRRYSHLYRFVLNQSRVIRHNLSVRAQQERDPEVAIDVQSASAIAPEDWERTRGLIEDFARDFRVLNPEGVVLVQATSPHDPETREQLGQLDGAVEGLRYLDWFEAANALAPEERRLPFDAHWNGTMHRLSAEAIYDALGDE